MWGGAVADDSVELGANIQGKRDTVQFGREVPTFRRVPFLHLQGTQVKSCRLVAIYRQHSLQ